MTRIPEGHSARDEPTSLPDGSPAGARVLTGPSTRKNFGASLLAFSLAGRVALAVVVMRSSELPGSPANTSPMFALAATSAATARSRGPADRPCVVLIILQPLARATLVGDRYIEFDRRQSNTCRCAERLSASLLVSYLSLI